MESNSSIESPCKKEICRGLRTGCTDNRRADLQGLRGVSILFVLAMHLAPTSFRLGFIGVDIFFVLSGFLMAKILLENSFTLWFAWSFLSRRFKRIVPLYMLLAVAVYIYGYFYILRVDRKQILSDLPWVYTYSSNLQPLFQSLGYWDQLSTYRFFVHTWSLGLEIQYYLIAPFIMSTAFHCEHGTRLILFACLGALSIIFQLCASAELSYGFLLSRIWQFMCGAIAYEFSELNPIAGYKLLSKKSGECTSKEDCNRKKDLSYGSMVAASVIKKALNTRLVSNSLANVLLLVLVLSVVTSPKYIPDNAARICSTFTAGIVVYLNTDIFFLTNAFMVYCGDISYVLYLVHWPVIVATRYSLDSQMLSWKGIIIIVLTVSFIVSIAIHHTLEKFFINKKVVTGFLCVAACYACILSTESLYLHVPSLESIPNTSKIDYAIEWNMRESHKLYFTLPCTADRSTHRYTKYKKEIQLRCVAKGNGTANILLVGNSIAYRAYPLIHEALKGRYSNFRLYSRGSCPPLSNWCPYFTEAMKKVVEHEKPDIVWYMHHCLYAPFVDPVQNLSEDKIYQEFQENIDFISNYTKHIVIDMPYYKSPFNTGAMLARRLHFSLPLGDEFVVTWQQHINQTQYHRLRLISLKCNKCIMNEINEALFKNGLFYLYDTETFLARLGDGLHMTPVGLELLRPLYTEVIEKLLQLVHN